MHSSHLPHSLLYSYSTVSGPSDPKGEYIPLLFGQVKHLRGRDPRLAISSFPRDLPAGRVTGFEVLPVHVAIRKKRSCGFPRVDIFSSVASSVFGVHADAHPISSPASCFLWKASAESRDHSQAATFAPASQ